MKRLHAAFAALRGKNHVSTPVETIKAQMLEPRPLPLGRKDFDEWSDRIISGALIPGATVRDQKFALADMLMHLGPTESHKPDAHFIHFLRKVCINQVAHAMLCEIKAEQAKEKAEADAKAKEQATA